MIIVVRIRMIVGIMVVKMGFSVWTKLIVIFAFVLRVIGEWFLDVL